MVFSPTRSFHAAGIRGVDARFVHFADVDGGLDADLNSIARVANGTNLYLIDGLRDGAGVF